MKQIKDFGMDIDKANEWLKQHKDYEVEIRLLHGKMGLLLNITIIYELLDLS